MPESKDDNVVPHYCAVWCGRCPEKVCDPKSWTDEEVGDDDTA